MKVNILGAEWTYDHIAYEEDENPINDVGGYCDFTTRRMVVYKPPIEATVRNTDAVVQETTRHEAIHAYLYESGLGEEIHAVRGHDEQIIDWFAKQYPKMKKTFEELGV